MLHSFFDDFCADLPETIEQILVVTDNAGAIPEEVVQSGKEKEKRSSNRWESVPVPCCVAHAPTTSDQAKSTGFSKPQRRGSLEGKGEVDLDYAPVTTDAEDQTQSLCTNSAPKRPQRRQSIGTTTGTLFGEDKISPSCSSSPEFDVKLDRSAMEATGMKPTWGPHRPKRRLSPPAA
ncbi:hypothetical protein SEMRO_641_G180000.1 [Seminavis robusta]|uniref:Uncharacterized protein n=1 Tax=Seminavis robusta TaxID=568900 RepID=A0A9N8HHJ6_9STRA|nr:hypothetical protein SEMRO_641_G180000.1 [Seminavis robusta]|eukprot:Sro641_g180000.1 n/a (177) ;mRNA; f:22472-23002